MTSPEQDVVLPMWRGRRGVVNTIFVSVLGAATAAAFWWCAVTVAVTPGCTAYATSRGLTFVDYTVYSRQIRSSGACVLKSRTGATEDVKIVDATSFLTDLWVGFAFSPQITVPGFIVLFAVALTRLRYGDRSRRLT